MANHTDRQTHTNTHYYIFSHISCCLFYDLSFLHLPGWLSNVDGLFLFCLKLVSALLCKSYVNTVAKLLLPGWGWALSTPTPTKVLVALCKSSGGEGNWGSGKHGQDFYFLFREGAKRVMQPTACQRCPLEMINGPGCDGQSQRGSRSVNSPVKERRGWA